MAGELEGWHKCIIRDTDYKSFVIECAKLSAMGFYLHKGTRKIQWPFFWKVRYKAEFRRNFIYADNQIAWVNMEEIRDLKIDLTE